MTTPDDDSGRRVVGDSAVELCVATLNAFLPPHRDDYAAGFKRLVRRRRRVVDAVLAALPAPNMERAIADLGVEVVRRALIDVIAAHSELRRLRDLWLPFELEPYRR